MGVSTGWSKYKGYNDFIELRNRLSDSFIIILIGVSKEQKASLPSGIIGIERTNNQSELVEYYSIADVFINPTYNDSFPTTNLEALACGTPIISYRTGGSPEAFDDETGVVVEKGDLKGLEKAILRLSNELKLNRDKISTHCRMRAEKLFNKEDRFLDYFDLFMTLYKKYND